MAFNFLVFGWPVIAVKYFDQSIVVGWLYRVVEKYGPHGLVLIGAMSVMLSAVVSVVFLERVFREDQPKRKSEHKDAGTE